MAQGPTVQRFTYVLLPCDVTCPLSLRTFEGLGGDEALREEIARYFQSVGMTTGQRQEMQQGILQEVQKKNAGGAPTSAASMQQMAAMMEANTTKFEIVPVIMPKKTNGFIGTSLYIDEVGRFKELPLNDRASRLAQRDIRGDAFLLSNYDDPVADSWARVDTSVERAEELIKCPPPAVPDPSQLMQQGSSSASVAALLTPLNLEQAALRKKEGNEIFAVRKFREARDVYTSALEMLDGRTDKVDASVVQDLQCALRLNRAQCSMRLGKYDDAVVDASEVLTMRCHTKALYVRCSANLHLKDFAACRADLETALAFVPGNEEFLLLKEQIVASESSSKAEEKRKFARMFD